MKIVIIGGVAAGTSAAAKARRNNEDAQIKIFDADEDISYSGCGLPYFIGLEVKERGQLVPRDASFFKQKYNVDVYIRHQVLEIHVESQTLTIQNLITRESFVEPYDELVIATGAQAIRPAITGVGEANVFHLRNVRSADLIRDYLLTQNACTAVVVGSGFIGLEMAENLSARGLLVSIVEAAEQVMPALDDDIAIYLEKYLQEKGVQVVLNDSVVALEGSPWVNKAILRSGREIETDLVVMAVGVRPNVELARKAGIEIGFTGAIKVNAKLQTNITGIYACGDCTESYSLITGKPFYRPLGSTANKMGRIVGDHDVRAGIWNFVADWGRLSLKFLI